MRPTTHPEIEHRHPAPSASARRMKSSVTAPPAPADTEGYSPSKGLSPARKGHHAVTRRRRTSRTSPSTTSTPANGVSELITRPCPRCSTPATKCSCPSPDYPAVNRLREPGRRHRRALPVRRTVRNGIRTSMTSFQDHQQHQGDCHHQPNNPTGALIQRSAPADRRIAREHQLIIFSDRIYDRLVMDGLRTSPSPRWPWTCSA